MTILYIQTVILFGGVLLVGWLCSIDKPLPAVIVVILMLVLLEYNRKKMEKEQKSEPEVES